MASPDTAGPSSFRKQALTVQFAGPRPKSARDGDVAVHHYPIQSRRNTMTVARINHEITRKLDLLQQRDERELPIIRVCEATKDEWRAYLGSNNQALKSKCCEWIEGSIYIVEFPLSQEHERFTRGIETALVRQPAFVAYMITHGSAVIPDHPELPDYEPDNSYGPRSKLRASFPPGVDRYGTWYSLVVEVGYSRGWGLEPGQLDWKARQWARFPGVRLILCVKVTERLESASYKLYTVQLNRWNRQLITGTNGGPVVGPQTVVSFDSRELLGLDPLVPIPPDPVSGERFPEPTVEIDLFAILLDAREDIA